MHAARLDRSGRLQRVVEALLERGELTTRELIDAANVCAVNSIASELRDNGHPVSCRQSVACKGGPRVWLYSLDDPFAARAALDRIAEGGDAR